MMHNTKTAATTGSSPSVIQQANTKPYLTPVRQPQTSSVTNAAQSSNLSAGLPATSEAAIRQYPITIPQQQARGRIELIFGCMFAGKTTELLRRCRQHEISGKRVLKIKFQADLRYGTDEFVISTHDEQKTKAIACAKLMELGNIWEQFDVVGVDEGQFFTDLVEFSEKAANKGKIVIISSLQGTFLRGPFPSILDLIPKCEEIKKLKAICKLCKHNASFTFRTASKECQTMIGGENMYMPLCRDCHMRETKLKKNDTYEGDPSVVNLDMEVKEQKKLDKAPEKTDKEKNSFTPESSTLTGTTQQSESPEAKSFSSSDELNQDEEISLRQKQNDLLVANKASPSMGSRTNPSSQGQSTQQAA